MWTCPKCERELKAPNTWHNCVKVSLDSLFEGKAEELVFAFDRLLAEVTTWQDIVTSTTANCIVFVRNQTFLIVRPMKKQLDLKFYSEVELTEFPVVKSTGYGNKFENHIRVAAPHEISAEVFRLLRKSYELL